MTTNILKFHRQTSDNLRKAAKKVKTLRAFVGFDGFVDQIIRLVDQRHSPQNYTTLSTILAFAKRIEKAAGKSTNIEMAVQRVKLGGNGPIVANALASFGLQTVCFGNLGFPELHPVFHDLAQKAKIYSVAEPALTLALEFDDGKIMMGQTEPLQMVTYENLMRHVGVSVFEQHWRQSHVICINNWTMLVPMTELWQKILQSHCDPQKLNREHLIFFDLADPEKRTRADLLQGLETLARFSPYFKVILGCNEKESVEFCTALQLEIGDGDKSELQQRAQQIRQRLQIDCVVIHPTRFSVAADANGTACVDGPYVRNPLISTGAGDHFNAGFCLASALDFALENALLTGVAASGYYVRKATPPTVTQLADFIENRPLRQE